MYLVLTTEAWSRFHSKPSGLVFLHSFNTFFKLKGFYAQRLQ